MKRATIISAIGTDSLCTQIYEQYKNLIPKEFIKKYQYRGGALNLPLTPDSQEFQEASNLMVCMKMCPDYYSEVYYTKKELENQPYFHVWLGDPLELEGTRAKDYGTQFVGGCPDCGLGGALTEDLKVDRKFLKNYKIGVICPEIFVSEETREIFEATDLSGISFEHEVKDYKGRDLQRKYYVMHVHHVLPPLSNETWLEHAPTTKKTLSCGHHRILMRSDLQYEHSKLDGALDFNLTNEYLNNDVARQLVVSAKARRVFKENKIRSAHFVPVVLL